MIEKIYINIKHDDRYSATIYSENGTIGHSGYALYIDGLGGGDYTKMTIDNATGKIENWVPLTEENLKEILED